MHSPASRFGFAVLGPLSAVVDGQDRTPRAAKVRSVLALLIANVGSVVTARDIAEELWADDSPDTAASAVYVYISQLRKLLGPRPGDGPGGRSMIESVRPGYRLTVPAESVDLTRFRSLADAGRQALGRGEPVEAAAALREALALWCGPAMQGIDSSGVLMRLAAGLDEQRMTLYEQLFGLELEQGRHREVLPELVELSRSHPMREGLAAQLMLAFYRSGQQAEALSTYRRVHAVLRDELGVDPGPELRDVHHDILAGTVAPAVSPRTLTAVPPATPPAQLMSTTADFVGRADALAAVRAALVVQAGVAPAYCEISGPGGVGKTALALEAAHRMRADFPDGQLFAQMRAGDGTAVDPGDILISFLVALGVDHRFVPDAVEDKARLLRTRLADRRVLVVLDDVVEEAQVRPLLPGSPGCAVLLTTRAPLLGLDGLGRVPLPMFTGSESVTMLRRMLGVERVDAEPRAVAMVARLCGYLPLALRVAGARLSVRPDRSISEFADSLTDERVRLDHLVAGDVGVRASIATSYNACTTLQRRALRLLASVALTDFPGWIVGVLLDTDEREGGRTLDGLVTAQLVQPLPTGHVTRFRLHDLVRIYADEVRSTEPVDPYCDGQRRLLDVLLWLVVEALRIARPGRPGGWPEPDGTHVPPGLAATVRHDPMGWAIRERANLVTSVERAHSYGMWESTAELAYRLSALFLSKEDSHGWRSVQRLGLDAARRAGDRTAEAFLVRDGADLDWSRGTARPALAGYVRSAALFRELGDRHATAVADLRIARVYVDRGPLDRAERLLDRALPVLVELDDRRGIASGLLVRGQIDRDRGRFTDAVDALERASDLFDGIGDADGRIQTLLALLETHRMGGQLDAHHRLAPIAAAVAVQADRERWEPHLAAQMAAADLAAGRAETAARRFRRCHDAFVVRGHVRANVITLCGLGDAYLLQGRADAAVANLNRARELAERSHDTRGRAAAYLGLGRAMLASGRVTAAVGSLSSAADVCRRSGFAVLAREATDLLEGSHRPLRTAG